MAEKYYTVGTHTAEGFDVIHDLLCSNTSLENIPDRACTCTNKMDHSPLRGVFLLTQSEANTIANRPEVSYATLNTATYIDTEISRIDPDDLKSVVIPAQSHTVAVTNNGADHYTIQSGSARNELSGDDPEIIIAVGDTLTMTNNASGHPLYFKTVGGAGTGDQVSTPAATGQGATGGSSVVWTPNTAGSYFYQCSAHVNMQGVITVKSNDQQKPASATPSLTAEAENRYDTAELTNVKNYMAYNVPTTPTIDDLNRTTSQLWRMTQKVTPWAGSSNADVISAMPKQRGAGEDVDVVVGDEGTWIAHPEFMMGVTNAVYPQNFIPGNALSIRDGSTSSTTCNLLDMFFDGPYILDQKWFDADASRKETRWDGTVVPTEVAARAWWASSAGRSADFTDFGGVTVTALYTRVNAGGTNTSSLYDGTHGTPCAGLVYGRTQGWAYNANKYYLDVYSGRGLYFEDYFDIMKIFHTYKPINPKYGTKNPTVSSNSWGYRVQPRSSGYYNHRGTDISYTSDSNSPELMRVASTNGDGRMKHFPKKDTHPELTAADECQASGVILVCAAGNDTQQQVTPDHPNYNNFHSNTTGQTWDETTWAELGGYWDAYATTNRGGFPQIAGQEQSLNDNGTLDTFGTINIGALDDDWSDGSPIGSQENKAYYSDFGPAIDCYAVADGTLSAASPNDASYERRYDETYPGLTANSGRGEDTFFNGTSAACPVAAGFLSTVMQYNRDWTWRELKKWIKALPQQESSAFAGQGTDYASATDSNWLTTTNLGGSDPIILYDYGVDQSSFPERKIDVKGNMTIKGVAGGPNKKLDKG